MFDSMITHIQKPKSVEWTNTKYIKLTTDEQIESNKDSIFMIKKGAENALHKYIDLKPSTSKEVFKKSEMIWKDLCKLLLERANELTNNEHFNLTDEYVAYLTNNQELVDVIDLKTENEYNQFCDKLDKFTMDVTTMDKTRKFYTDCKGGLVKLIAYDKHANITQEDFTPAVFIEFNTNKSKYIVYTGIIIYKNNPEATESTMRFIPSTTQYLDTDYLSAFISHFDMDEALLQAKQNGDGLYAIYSSIIENPIKLSAREITVLMKKLGYKLSVKPDDNIGIIEQISDDVSNEMIQDFFNTFITTTGETALDILNLSDVKKVFRYNTLTTVDILDILSKEYLSFMGARVTCDLLSDYVYTIYTRHVDKNQADSIKDEINND